MCILCNKPTAPQVVRHVEWFSRTKDRRPQFGNVEMDSLVVSATIYFSSVLKYLSLIQYRLPLCVSTTPNYGYGTAYMPTHPLPYGVCAQLERLDYYWTLTIQILRAWILDPGISGPGYTSRSRGGLQYSRHLAHMANRAPNNKNKIGEA
jgi:hypothetical protein